MELTQSDKKHYLHKAIEIAIASCATPTSSDKLTEIIQETYNKLIGIASQI